MNGITGDKNMNSRDKKEMEMALVAGAKARNFSLMEKILGMGINPNSCISGVSVLHMAVVMDDCGLAGWLASRGASANTCDKSGQTPLHYAVARNNPVLALNLMEIGGDILAQDKKNRTPLELAPNGDVVAFLKKMADVRSSRMAREKAAGHMPSPAPAPRA
ncbi:MAG: hypothetical protein A2018_05255 [Alphaproteobacteria bacterium GWF2_58_20]|nr:MAG: hypothetical protein A2018_05255 [Alphaproteobacteria bacterium GWF2_58_20]